MAINKTRKIIISPGFGAGWTTWASGPKEMIKYLLEQPDLIEYIESGKLKDQHQIHDWDSNCPEDLKQIINKIETYCKNTWGESSYVYFGGLRDAEVVEIPDVPVRVTEYDGKESYILFGDEEYL
jgi:hypothetical protein